MALMRTQCVSEIRMIVYRGDVGSKTGGEQSAESGSDGCWEVCPPNPHMGLERELRTIPRSDNKLNYVCKPMFTRPWLIFV